MAEPTSLAPVVMLHQIRTLVIARDLAFRQRSLTVLGDLGVVSFAVISLEATAPVLDLVKQERADVVVLDTTACAPAVARVVHELAEALPRVGVVLVGTRGDRSHRLPTLDKWGWAAELSNAVQQAYHRGNPWKEDSVDVYQQPG